MKKVLLTLVSFFGIAGNMSLSLAQEFEVGGPLGAVNEAGNFVAMSANVKVYGSFHFTESCTFDPERNLILSMNRGNDGGCLLYTSPSPRDRTRSRMPSSA